MIEKYKYFKNELAVKGLNSRRTLGFNVICAAFLFWIMLLTLVVYEIEDGDDIFAVCMFLLIFMLIAQSSLLHSYIKTLRKVIVFNKHRGVIKFYEDDECRVFTFGKARYWYIQEVLHKSIRGGFHDHHIVLVGSRGKKYIGLSALTKKGAIKKLQKLNDYFQMEFVFSETSISSYEAAWLQR